MDPRLREAACVGDVGALQKLLHEDSLVLSEATLLTCSSTSPLHIAAMLGHTDFAKFVMSRNPELVTDLNHLGYSPIHLASIKGHLPIVTDLLNLNKELCFLKDSEDRTPLHGAAIKGRLKVIAHLMSCCPESAMEVTAKGETLLHLVVNNGQKEALVLLISSLREQNLLQKLIDRVNEDGKTALQLAIARNQNQMTKMLSREIGNGHEITDIHEARIDIAVPSSSDGDDLPRKDKLVSLHNAIIVVCSLLATCCFDAIVSPPGGVWQNRPSREVIQTENIKNISAFQRLVLGSNTTLTDLLAPNKAMSMALQPNAFSKFLLADATCFTSSLATIYLVTGAVCCGKEEMRKLRLAIFVMLQIVVFSAIALYLSIIQLTSNAGAHFPVIWAVLWFLPSTTLLPSCFMKHCWPPISSRLASCYSRLRVDISNRYEKMIAKVFLTQLVTK